MDIKNRIRVIQFRTEYRPGKEPLDWVEFTSSDAVNDSGQAMHTTWEVVKRIMPPEDIPNDDGGFKMAAMRSQWNQIGPAYESWKSGEEAPESGTPIAAWAGVNTDQAAALRGVGIKTVEAMAAVSEGILSKPILPNMRELKRQAAMWLEGQSSAALAAQIAELQAQNAAMLEMLAERAAEADDEAENKPRRGRPRKEEASAE
jgi:hypothetical protein